MTRVLVSRRSIAVTLALALLLCVLPLGPGSGAASVTQATLTLDSATVNASWKESWLKGNVAVKGTVSADSELKVFLRRIDPKPTVVAARISISATAGTYTGTLKFPNRARPGTYVVHVSGTSGSEKLAPVETTVTLPAPEEGIVNRAYVSKTKRGKAVRRVKGPVKRLFATFRFEVPPSSVRSVRLVWRTPQFNFVGEVRKRYSKKVTTFIKSGRPLPKGTWYCLLTVNEIVTKRVLVRIR